MSRTPEPRQACSYCGLPVPRAWSPRKAMKVSITAGRDEPAYCCLGCRVAAAVTQSRGEDGETRFMLAQLGLAIFFTMNVMVFTMVLWSQDVYGAADPADAALNGVLPGLFRYVALVCSAPVLLLLGGPLVEGAVQDLRRGAVTTDLLIALGVAAAFVYSAVSVVRDTGHVYFEVACMVLVVITLGRWLEASGRLKTTEALRSLEKLLPDRVRVVTATGPSTTDEIKLDDVSVGQVIRVLAGERIPVDGRIERNQAAIDEQIVTGESQPRIKEPNDEVFAGTLNLDGDLFIRVTSSPHAGALQRLIDAVTQAATAKSTVTRLADRVAAWFVPAVTVISAVTFAWHASTADFHTGLMAALAVLVIACPCALGIATPLAVWAALARAAHGGVLFRDGDAVTRLATVKSICFDKTGTLTTGCPKVESFVSDGDTEATHVLLRANVLAAASTHGHSEAIRKFVLERNGKSDGTDGDAILPMPVDVQVKPGRGIVAKLDADGGLVCLGSPRMMEEAGMTFGARLQHALGEAQHADLARTCIGWDGRVRGAFFFREQLRDEAARTMSDLRAAGFHLSMLTGDHSTRADEVRLALGIDAESELLPEEKSAAIEDMRRRIGVVAMVGDGINDAPALAAADVGIAMGCGADVSRDAADVCLLGNDLGKLPWAIELSRRAVRTIRVNLFWAFSYNVVGIGLAASGWLNPIIAAVAMVGSSVLVVTNSLRLTQDRVPTDARVNLQSESPVAPSATTANQRAREFEAVAARAP